MSAIRLSILIGLSVLATYCGFKIDIMLGFLTIILLSIVIGLNIYSYSKLKKYAQYDKQVKDVKIK